MFWAQSTIGHTVNYEELRIDSKLIWTPSSIFDSSQSYMIEIEDLIIFCAQSTISQSTILHEESKFDHIMCPVNHFELS